MDINWQRRRKNHEDSISSGSLTRPKNVVHEVPTYSAMGSGFRKIAENKKEALAKLYDIAHYTAVRGCTFTNFEDLFELEKLHGIKF